MHFLATLLPFLALTAARGPLPHAHSKRVTAPSLTVEHELDARGLLDGLLGTPASSTSKTSNPKTTTSAATYTTSDGGLLGGLLGSPSSSSATATSTANPGLLGGLIGSPSSTASSPSASSTDLVDGLVSGLGAVVDTTVTTVGGVVEDVADLNLQVLANTCVRLGAAADLGVLAGANAAGLGVGSATDVVLAAGACVCVDAAASVGLNSGIYAGVNVFASGGLYFNGSTAEDIASSTQPGLLGLSAGVYNFDVVETCIAAEVSLSNSYHNLQVPGGSCCARACNPGYFMDSTGACVSTPTCSSTEILCNNQCYPRSSYTCPSGMPVSISAKRSLTTCPLGQSKCSVGGFGEEKWECVDTQQDLESCGGCMYPSPFPVDLLASPQGMDCTAIPNVDQVSCSAGACQVQSCTRGFTPSINGTSCEVQPRRRNISRSSRAMPFRTDSI